jgi:hypothetical protein
MPTVEESGCDVHRDGDVTVVKGKTYPIREQLKARGGRWDPDHKAWNFDRTSPRKVMRYVQDAIDEVQGYDPKFKFFSDVEKHIDEAHEVWNEELKKKRITTQKPTLMKAGIRAFYIAHGETNPKYHYVLRYSDPVLAVIAEKAAEVLRSHGIETKHERGQK